MKKEWLLSLFLVAVFGFSGSAGAALTGIGTASYDGNSHNLIYMDDGPFGPITWLDYTRTYDTWTNQVSWASNLSFTGAQVTLVKVRDYLSEYWDLFDNNKVFSCDKNFKYLCLVFTSMQYSVFCRV